MSNLDKHFKNRVIVQYLSELMNTPEDDIKLPDMYDYTFMKRYLSVALSLDEEVRAEYLPEPMKFVLDYTLPKHRVVDDFLAENKDKFFELFYYYKGLNSL